MKYKVTGKDEREPETEGKNISIVGMTPAQARTHSKNIRVVKENGARLTFSPEYRADRINVAVVNGKITEILGVG